MGQPLQTWALGSENKLNYEHLRIFLIEFISAFWFCFFIYYYYFFMYLCCFILLLL